MDKKAVIIRVCSVAINAVLAFAGFVGTVFGLLFMSPYPIINFGHPVEPRVCMSDFILGLIMIFAAVIVPVIVNLVLYRFWYSKNGLSRKWINIPIGIITAGLLFISVVTAVNYMDGWLSAVWYW